ncbi:hypothetical protein F5I97DRAFT_1904060 [Phlebopus sp. FC_14]|nr:hypothetical protein F5I97DRAFT_1904060 [Phlebopus sp. FC_14]
MYGDSRAIISWVNAIYSDDRSVAKPNDPSADVIYTFPFHPYRDADFASPVSEDSESESSISFCFDGSAWVSALPLTPLDSSDDSVSTCANSDDGAQYISIPADSPWYRPPVPPSPKVATAQELCSGTYPNSCSSDVRQAIAQQEHLLNIFHEELCRIIPDGYGFEYNSDWLDDCYAD